MVTTIMGQRIKKLRRRRGLTQCALADRVGVTETYISMLECAERTNPSLGLLKKLAKALKVPVAELLQ